MAGERTESGTPGAEVQALSGRLDPPPPGQVPRTLASQLVPVADRIRELYSRFGVRPYLCFLLHVGWPGERGDGQPQVLSRVPITPTPRVINMDGTTEVMFSTGLTEQGGILVDQISPRYTEDDLLGVRMAEMADPVIPATNSLQRQFFWQVVENRPSTPRPQPRLYVPSGVPMLSRDGFQWKIALVKTDPTPGRRSYIDITPDVGAF